MRTLIASFIATLCLTTALLAQDKDEPKPAPKAEPAEAKPAPRERSVEELVKEIESQLENAHDPALAQLVEQLCRQLNEKLEDADVDLVVVDPERGGLTLRAPTAALGLLIAPDGAETMTGSFEEDGLKGKYTLKSTGDGQYQLEAEITGEDDTSSTVKDKGTFAGLRAKYKWLRGGAMLAPRVWVRKDLDIRGGPAAFPIPTPATTTQPLVGVVVRPPSDELRHHLEFPVGAGLIIDSVTPGSRAEKLGLRKYDVLLRIDGDLVEDPDQVRKLNDSGVTLEYVRRASSKRLVTE